jgi:acetyl-CoA C-acetyltransferase
MEHDRNILVLSAVRTAIGKYGGGLAAVPPCDLAATVVREAVSRAGVAPDQVGHAVFGHVIHTEPRDMYLSRVAAVNGGLPVGTPAFGVNRLCGSGLQAIVSAAQAIRLGDCDVAVAGGAESMSRGQYWLPGLRWGQRMNDGTVVDAMVGALTDPFDGCHMGVTAENVAADYGVSREEQDALAAESHRRAAAAAAAGYFASQITPVQVPSRKDAVTVDADEHIRPGLTIADLARLKPAFAPEGTVTAGNASGVNDAAAAVVLAGQDYAERHADAALGWLVAYAHAGVEPRVMGIGPVPAVRAVLERAHLKLDDIDLFEVNEAFAAQALAVVKELGLPADRTNPNGSGISLGHPVGATGAILTVKALYELRRTGGRYALVTMCIGGGQGIAAVFERL